MFMNRVWRLVAIVSIALTAAVTTGCGSNNNNSPSLTPTQSSPGTTTQATTNTKPIVIGAAIAKTGLLQPYDVPAYTAFKMAVDEANAKGGVNGRKIEIIDEDTKSEIANGATVAKDLLSKGADIMVVSCDYDFGSPAAQVAQQAGKISFSLCAQSPKFGAQGIGDKAYTVSESVLTEGAVVATFGAQQKHLKKAFLLVDDTLQYDRGLCDGFKKAFTALGGKIAGEEHWKGGSDSISSQITTLKAASPDSVMLCSIPPAGSGALRQMRSAGITQPILSGGGMDGTYWVKAVPGISDFFITTQVSVFGNDPNPAVNSFVKRYAKVAGSPPATAYAPVGYSAAQAILKALEQTGGDPSGDVMKAKLDAFNKVPLLVGPTTFTPEFHIPVDRPMTVLEYSNGKPKAVGRLAPGIKIGLTV
jgi:branched-chain amino acid transport system substrate-binding protein